jgi:type II secretory pathway component PulF
MEAAAIDDFLALNDQLAALALAGVPISIELAQEGAGAAETLEKINAVVARRVSQGESLSQALAHDDRFLTPSYRSLVQLGLRSGGLAPALEGAHRLAESREESRQAVRLSLLYPAIVCGLAYLGLIGFCLFFVPTLENMNQDMRIQAGAGLRTLQWLRSSLPYWVAIPPLGLVLVTGWQRLKSKRIYDNTTAALWAWLPGMKRAANYERYASFAESLATLIQSGAPLAESVKIASGLCSPPLQGEEMSALVADPSQAQVPVDDQTSATRLPPFLTWALWHSEATTGRPMALLMAADIYRVAAARRQERLRTIVPLIACVVLGGSVTLLYGLALFLPVVEMLRGLASSS